MNQRLRATLAAIALCVGLTLPAADNVAAATPDDAGDPVEVVQIDLIDVVDDGGHGLAEIQRFVLQSHNGCHGWTSGNTGSVYCAGSSYAGRTYRVKVSCVWNRWGQIVYGWLYGPNVYAPFTSSQKCYLNISGYGNGLIGGAYLVLTN